jgi:hypothetical protein
MLKRDRDIEPFIMRLDQENKKEVFNTYEYTRAATYNLGRVHSFIRFNSLFPPLSLGLRSNIIPWSPEF